MRDPPTKDAAEQKNGESIMGRSAIGHEQRPIHPPNDPGSGKEGVMMWEASGGKLVEWKTDDSSSGHYRQPKPMARCDSRDGHPDRTVGVNADCKPSSQSRPSLVINSATTMFYRSIGFPAAASGLLLHPLGGQNHCLTSAATNCVHA